MLQTDATAHQTLEPAIRRGTDNVLADRQDMYRRVASNLDRPRGVEPESPEEAARQAAEDFVALALVQPLLKQLRESNDAEPPFAPGPAEEQFGALMDAEIAQRVVRASNFPVVERVAQDLLERHEKKPDQPIGASLEIEA